VRECSGAAQGSVAASARLCRVRALIARRLRPRDAAIRPYHNSSSCAARRLDANRARGYNGPHGSAVARRAAGGGGRMGSDGQHRSDYNSWTVSEGRELSPVGYRTRSSRECSTCLIIFFFLTPVAPSISSRAAAPAGRLCDGLRTGEVLAPQTASTSTDTYLDPTSSTCGADKVPARRRTMLTAATLAVEVVSPRT
jgi:hypothetical protein